MLTNTETNPVPLRAPHNDADGSALAMAASGASGPAANVTAKRVLIVDDEPNIVMSLEFLMKRAGYEVRVARDGEAALAAIAESAPDLILLDVMMPKLDGFAVCESVRKRRELADVKVVIVSARGREVEKERGLALGANAYVTKPFATRDLVAQVEKLLGSA